MKHTTLALLGIALVIALPSPSRATPNKCSALKMSCLSKATVAQLKCHVRAEKIGVSAVYDPAIAACLQKARAKFRESDFSPNGCFATLEAKYPGGCLTTGDVFTFDAKIQDFINDVVTDLDPVYPAAVLNACSAAKKACVAKKAAALLRCHQKHTQPPGGDPATLTACRQRAMASFDGGAVPAKGCFAKLEAKYPGACLTTDDTAAVEAKTDAYVDDAVCGLDPGASACAAVPTPTPTPTAVCSPAPTPSPNPSHACCLIAGYGCADMPPINAGDCLPLGGSVVPGGFCTCGGGCVVP